jgi:hypothetical protein
MFMTSEPKSKVPGKPPIVVEYGAASPTFVPGVAPGTTITPAALKQSIPFDCSHAMPVTVKLIVEFSVTVPGMT